jgi:hypothetical protein
LVLLHSHGRMGVVEPSGWCRFESGSRISFTEVLMPLPSHAWSPFEPWSPINMDQVKAFFALKWPRRVITQPLWYLFQLFIGFNNMIEVGIALEKGSLTTAMAYLTLSLVILGFTGVVGYGDLLTFWVKRQKEIMLQETAAHMEKSFHAGAQAAIDHMDELMAQRGYVPTQPEIPESFFKVEI